MKKKLYSIALIATMLASVFPHTAFAQGSTVFDDTDSADYAILSEKVSEKFSKEELHEVYEESKFLAEEITFFKDLLVDVNKEGENYVFKLDYGYTTNEISIIQNDDEKITILIEDHEMNISNILECHSNGKTLIDGFEVFPNAETAVVEPKASSNWWTQTCPYGKPVDYNVYAGHKENKNIPLGNKIEKITVSAFIKICIPIIGDMLSDIYNDLYYYLKGANPGATAFSYKADMYYHKNQRSAGYIPAANMYVTKNNFTWYPQINFGGTNRYETWYDCTRLG